MLVSVLSFSLLPVLLIVHCILLLSDIISLGFTFYGFYFIVCCTVFFFYKSLKTIIWVTFMLTKGGMALAFGDLLGKNKD